MTQASTALVPRCDVPTDMDQLVNMANMLSRAHGVVPSELFGKPEAIMAYGLAARAMDIPWWTALQELYQAKSGRIGQSAKLVRYLLRRAGHQYHFEVTDTECTGWIRRAGEEKVRHVTYTYMDAQRLGLPDRNPEWEKQPQSMLVARWSLRTASRWAPEVVLGLDSDDRSTASVEDLREGASTGEEIGADTAQVLLEAGEAAAAGKLDEIKKLWQGNLILLDTWAGEGESLREVLTRMMVRALITTARKTPGDVAALRKLWTGNRDLLGFSDGGQNLAQTLTEMLDAATKGTPAPPKEKAGQDEQPEQQDGGQQAEADGDGIVDAEIVGDGVDAGGDQGVDVLPCGCPVAKVIAAGAHTEDCKERTR